MEELYRRVSDNQTMGSVVDELRATSLRPKRRWISFPQPARNPRCWWPYPASWRKCVAYCLCWDWIRHLWRCCACATRWSVCSSMRFLTQTSPAHSKKLGSNLGALGFLIDMLNYQRAMARKLFVYDEEAGELRILTAKGRRGPPTPRKKLQPSWKSEQHNRCLRSCHASRWKSPRRADRFLAIPRHVLGQRRCTADPRRSVGSRDLFDFAEAASPAVSPAPAPIEFAVKEQLAVEDELLEVFLEEARRWWSTAPRPSQP